jgi:hypothetical protein
MDLLLTLMFLVRRGFGFPFLAPLFTQCAALRKGGWAHPRHANSAMHQGHYYH